MILILLIDKIDRLDERLEVGVHNLLVRLRTDYWATAQTRGLPARPGGLLRRAPPNPLLAAEVDYGYANTTLASLGSLTVGVWCL